MRKDEIIEGHTVKQVLNRGIQIFQKRGLEPAALLAERLMEGLLNCKRYELYLDADRALEEEQVRSFFHCVDLRLQSVPCQYILGKADFMDYTFRVDASVLIPRPETELLVEQTMAVCRRLGCEERELQILDLGTGSGNIAVSLAAYLPNVSVWAADISDGALQMARYNACRNEVAHRMKFVKSDGFSAIPEGIRFDVIVSNPPYLSQAEMEAIDPEVKKEPVLALLGGAEGTEFIDRLAREAKSFLKPDGVLLFEIGGNQGMAVSQLLIEAGWKNFEILKDYSDWDRVVSVWTSSLSREGRSLKAK